MGCVGIKKLFKIVFILLLFAALLWVYARCVEPMLLQTKKIVLVSPRVEADYSIAVLSDMHLGNGVDTERMAKIVEKVNAMNTDAVVFLGDLYDNYLNYSGDTVADAAVLAKISAPVKLAVWGNHDMGGGAFKRYPQLMQESGFTLLENDSIDVNDYIRFSGVANITFGSPSVIGMTKKGVYNILLCHEPDFGASVRGFELQLSGHSHGGQINIPFVGPPVLPEDAKIYSRGLYEKEDGLVYVNRGIGMSIMPYRFGAMPEITLVTIKKE